MKIADISLFESLMGQKTVPCNVNNSAAAKLLLDYSKALQSVRLCKKYINDMQKEEDEADGYVPSSMVSAIYSLKEKCEEELIALEEQLVTQVSNEPLDAWDSKVFTKLSGEAREALRDILEDDVIKRAMEMQAEALEEMSRASEEAETEETKEVPVKETAVKPKAKKEDTQEISDEASTDDDYGLDVSSVEG